MTKTGKTFLISLFLILLVSAGFFLWKERETFWPEIKEGEVPSESEIKSKKMSSPSTAEQSIRLTLGLPEIITYATANIDELSPVEPVLGGKWQVVRFWFVADYDFYVEYEDGHILRQILICARGTDAKPQFNVVAYFEPGENEWLLKKGEDIMYGSETTLYEKDIRTGQWARRN